MVILAWRAAWPEMRGTWYFRAEDHSPLPFGFEAFTEAVTDMSGQYVREDRRAEAEVWLKSLGHTVKYDD